MKDLIGDFEALPSKRIYNPIITDYDFEKSICELVDNALDIWVKNKRQIFLKVEIDLDIESQTIFIRDNAGGIKRQDLKLVVAPGHSSNLMTDETIGIFGVGSKRAVVHLARNILIRTHHCDEITYQIEYDEVWIKDEMTWKIPIYKVDQIPANETHIELLKLRYNMNSASVDKLRRYLSEVYCKFLDDSKLQINVNGVPISPINFENFSGHPEYSPQEYTITVFTTYGEKATVRILAGVTTASSVSEYGVYLYCNERLIVKAVKDENVGASLHPECAIAKVILFINGSADLMPWNSSKSGFNYNNEVFLAIQAQLKGYTSHYMKLSRSLSANKQWKDVANYTDYKVTKQDLGNISEVKRAVLPVIPQMRYTVHEKLTTANEAVLDSKPWTRALFDSIQAVELILHKSYKQRNRIALILLDSSLEIGLKDYLVFQSGQTYTTARLQSLFDTINSGRKNVIKEVRKYTMTGAKYEKYWNKVEFYYKKRCDLIHSTATPSIEQDEINEYKETVEHIFTNLFDLKFEL